MTLCSTKLLKLGLVGHTYLTRITDKLKLLQRNNDKHQKKTWNTYSYPDRSQGNMPNRNSDWTLCGRELDRSSLKLASGVFGWINFSATAWSTFSYRSYPALFAIGYWSLLCIITKTSYGKNAAPLVLKFYNNWPS